jgi:hypothetical protein
MTPSQPRRYRRKGRRDALRGVPGGTGRSRQQRAPETTYGAGQQDRDHRLTWLWLTARAEMEADFAARERAMA